MLNKSMLLLGLLIFASSLSRAQVFDSTSPPCGDMQMGLDVQATCSIDGTYGEFGAYLWVGGYSLYGVVMVDAEPVGDAAIFAETEAITFYGNYSCYYYEQFSLSTGSYGSFPPNGYDCSQMMFYGLLDVAGSQWYN